MPPFRSNAAAAGRRPLWWLGPVCTLLLLCGCCTQPVSSFGLPAALVRSFPRTAAATSTTTQLHTTSRHSAHYVEDNDEEEGTFDCNGQRSSRSYHSNSNNNNNNGSHRNHHNGNGSNYNPNNHHSRQQQQRNDSRDRNNSSNNKNNLLSNKLLALHAEMTTLQSDTAAATAWSDALAYNVETLRVKLELMAEQSVFGETRLKVVLGETRDLRAQLDHQRQLHATSVDADLELAQQQLHKAQSELERQSAHVTHLERQCSQQTDRYRDELEAAQTENHDLSLQLQILRQLHAEALESLEEEAEYARITSEHHTTDRRTSPSGKQWYI